MRTRQLLQSLVLLLALWGLPATALDLKTPPPNGIHDPGGFLDEEFSSSIADRIAYEKTYRGFEVFVILFEKEPSQGASILARQAGESWSTGEYWAAIYQVGKEAEPDCLVGGSNMNALPDDLVERTNRGARNTALLVNTPQNRLEELVHTLSDAFGFLRVKATEMRESQVKEFDEKMARLKERRERRRVFIVLAAVLLLALGTLFTTLWKKRLRKLRPMTFPLTSPRRRLAAPFSGGGDVLVGYGRKR